MKTKLIKNITAPLVVASVLLSMVAATATGEGTPGGILQGTWEMQLQRTNCAGTPLGPPAQSVAIIMAGGTMMESQAPRPDHGTWRVPSAPTPSSSVIHSPVETRAPKRYNSLKSPLCSCVSIAAPAAS
jgi:hypothetical protein